MLVVEHIAQAVAAKEIDIGGLDIIGHPDNVDIRILAAASDAVGDDAAMLGGAEHIVEGVVGGELFQRSVAETVETAVATIDGEELALITGDAHQRGSHAPVLRIGTALGIDNHIDGLQPRDHHLVEIAGIQSGREIVEEELKIMQGVATGHLATIMSAHAIGNGDNRPFVGRELYVLGKLVVSYKGTANQNHVFIVLSDTADSAGSRHTQIHHC